MRVLSGITVCAVPVIGERKRAYLVVQLARFFYICLYPTLPHIPYFRPHSPTGDLGEIAVVKRFACHQMLSVNLRRTEHVFEGKGHILSLTGLNVQTEESAYKRGATLRMNIIIFHFHVRAHLPCVIFLCPYDGHLSHKTANNKPVQGYNHENVRKRSYTCVCELQAARAAPRCEPCRYRRTSTPYSS